MIGEEMKASIHTGSALHQKASKRYNRTKVTCTTLPPSPFLTRILLWNLYSHLIIQVSLLSAQVELPILKKGHKTISKT